MSNFSLASTPLLEAALEAAESESQKPAEKRGRSLACGAVTVTGIRTRGRYYLIWRFSEDIVAKVGWKAGDKIHMVEWEPDGDGPVETFLIGSGDEDCRSWSLWQDRKSRHLRTQTLVPWFFPAIGKQTECEVLEILPVEYEGDTGVLELRVPRVEGGG